jgi:transposase
MTRTRTAVTRERTPEIQRLEKLLEDAGIKLSSVASDLTGVSGRAMLEALIAGQSDPAAMADLAKKRMRVKIPQLTEALHGRFTSHHAFLTRMHLNLIDQHTAAIEQLADRIEVVIEPFRSFRDLICTIPGIGGRTADIIVAETGADMTRFPTAQYLASWAGTTPGNNESAGKVKSRRTRPGNPYLQGALGTAAMSISHTHGTYLAAKYRRIATRRGPLKANVAVQRALLVAIWNTAMTNTTYHDPGGDYFTHLNPQRARNNAVRQLEAMGYHVTSTRHPDRAAHPADSPHGNLLVRLEESGVARRSKHRESSKKGGKSRLTRPISARMPLCQTAPLDPRPRRRQRTPPCIAQRHINRHEPRRRQGHRSLSLVPRRCGRLRSDGRGRELVSKEIGVHYMERFGEQLEELDIKSIPAKRKSS